MVERFYQALDNRFLTGDGPYNVVSVNTQATLTDFDDATRYSPYTRRVEPGPNIIQRSHLSCGEDGQCSQTTRYDGENCGISSTYR